MTNVAVVVNADDDFGRDLCHAFSGRGWTVFGGVAAPLDVDLTSIESMKAAASTVAAAVDYVDLLIWNPPVPLSLEGRGAGGEEVVAALEFDFESIKRDYDVEGLGPVRLVEAFLPLMASGRKHICFLTDRSVSIGAGPASTDNAGVRIARSTVPMAAMLMSNHLGKQGYHIGLCLADDPEKVCEYLISGATDTKVAVQNAQGELLPF